MRKLSCPVTLLVALPFVAGCIPDPDEFPFEANDGDGVEHLKQGDVDTGDLPENPPCSADDCIPENVSTAFGGLAKPWGVATNGATAWIATHDDCTISAVDPDSGRTSRLAGRPGDCGSDDGSAENARFDHPSDIALLDGALYVLERGPHSLRRVDVQTGRVDTIRLRWDEGPPGRGKGDGDDDDDDDHGGGGGPVIRLDEPTGIATDGDHLFVVSSKDARVLRVTRSGILVDVIEHDRFKEPFGLATDGSTLWVADRGHHVVHAVSLMGMGTKALAGESGREGSVDGVGSAARLSKPIDLSLGPDDALYLTEEKSLVRRIDLRDGLVTTLAGEPGQSGQADGTGDVARFDEPRGIASIGTGTGSLIVVSDFGGGTVRVLR